MNRFQDLIIEELLKYEKERHKKIFVNVVLMKHVLMMKKQKNYLKIS